jgi:hypothetical protein
MAGKHADPLELAQETLADREERLQAVWTDLSWRAKRYAMDQKWVEHDIMVEALNSFLTDTTPNGFDPEVDQSCNCREKYDDKPLEDNG